MSEKFSRWDSANYLKTEQDCADYFALCIKAARENMPASEIKRNRRA